MKEFFKAKNIVQYFVIPFALLAVYCVSFGPLTSQFIPPGVNGDFATKFFKYVVGLLAFFTIMAITLLIIKKEKSIIGKSPWHRLSNWDILLLVIPLTPVFQYIVINRGILSFLDIIIIISFFTLCASVYIFIIPVLMSIFSPVRVLMSLGVAFVFCITNMATLSREFAWYKTGDLLIQAAVFAFCLFAVWALLGIKNKGYIALLVLLYSASTIGIQLFTNEPSKNAKVSWSDHPLPAMVLEKEPVFTPTVYLLVYDAYVPNETMLSSGFDNQAQEDFLKDKGFILYPHTYSVGAWTPNTMSRVLNASTKYYGTERRGISGDGIVQNAFKEIGYDTYGIFPTDFNFRGNPSSYDFTVPSNQTMPPYKVLISAILLGEFRFDVGFQNTHTEYVNIKQNILREISGKQVLIYSHSNFPAHAQFSGKCQDNENELYQRRVSRANTEMQQDIEIITENDPGAIIIVAGDHGPYLTKNCQSTRGAYNSSEITREDIQSRFGTFLAIKWPTDDYQNFDDITVIQDVFPAVFGYIYNDKAFLELKIPSKTIDNTTISGVYVQDGIIHGGVNDGEPLFLSGK